METLLRLYGLEGRREKKRVSCINSSVRAWRDGKLGAWPYLSFFSHFPASQLYAL